MNLLQNLLQNCGHAWSNWGHARRTSDSCTRLVYSRLTWSTQEQPLDRLQNGCSASFLVEGRFDSQHRPPECELEIRTSVLAWAGQSGRARYTARRGPFPDLLQICCKTGPDFAL